MACLRQIVTKESIELDRQSLTNVIDRLMFTRFSFVPLQLIFHSRLPP